MDISLLTLVSTAVLNSVSFTPVQCPVCPLMTWVDFPMDTLDGRTGYEKDVYNLTKYSPHSYDRRWVSASRYVADIAFEAVSFQTELGYDSLKLRQYPNSMYIISGSPTTPKWLDVATSTTLQAVPVEMTWTTDGSVQYSGFEIDTAAVCCQSSPGQSVSSSSVLLSARNSGVLLGTNDVVYFWVPAAATGEQLNFALWNSPEASFDADLYVRCGAFPTPTQYTKRGYTNYEEFLTVSNAECSGQSIYIAVHSYTGSGRFDLVVSKMPMANNLTLNVAAETTSPTELAEIAATMESAAKRVYAATEGQVLINTVNIYPKSSGTVPNNSYCALACPGYCAVCFVEESGLAHTPNIGSFPIIMTSDYRDAQVVVHEFAHGYLGVDDEYIPPGTSQCGHSIMGNTWNPSQNLCIGGTYANHNLDREGGAGPTSEPPAWAAAAHITMMTNWTPDPYNFVDHDFNGLFNVVIK